MKTRSWYWMAAVLIAALALLTSGGATTAQDSLPATTTSTLTVSTRPTHFNQVVGSAKPFGLHIADVEALTAFETRIDYDPNLLQVNDVTLGDFLGSTGRNVGLLGPIIDNNAGTVLFGAFSYGSAPPVSGSGMLAFIEVTAVGVGDTTLDLHNSIFVGVENIPFPNTEVDGSIRIGGSSIFGDGFESGTLSSWSVSKTDLGDLSVSPTAALIGSKGLQALIDSNGAIYVQDNTPNNELHYLSRFNFDPNSIQMKSGNVHDLFVGRKGSITPFRIQVRYFQGSYQLGAQVRKDGAGYLSTPWYPISDEPHYIEIDWQASTLAGSNSGYLNLWIDNAFMGSISDVDNDTRRVNEVRLGPSAGIDKQTRGTYYLDGFDSWR